MKDLRFNDEHIGFIGQTMVVCADCIHVAGKSECSVCSGTRTDPDDKRLWCDECTAPVTRYTDLPDYRDILTLSCLLCDTSLVVELNDFENGFSFYD